MSVKQAIGVFAVMLIVASITVPMKAFSAGTLVSTLAWANPLNVVDGIQIEKSSSLTGVYSTLRQVAAGSVGYSDGTNGAGETACYRIAYYNTSGVGPYLGPLCKTFPTIPTQTPATFSVN